MYKCAHCACSFWGSSSQQWLRHSKVPKRNKKVPTALLTMLACKPGHLPCSLLAQSQVNARCLAQSQAVRACLFLCQH